MKPIFAIRADVIGDRIKTAREKRGMTLTDLAARLGVTRQAVGAWEKGGIPRPDKIPAIAAALDVDIAWLERGASYGGGRLMPVKGEVAAGTWREAVELEDLEPIPVSPSKGYPAEAQFALLVRGTSINKIASDSEYLIVVDVLETGISPRSGDIVVVRRTRHGVTEASAKRLAGSPGNWTLEFESTDPKYQGTMSIGENDDDTEIVISAIVLGKYTPISRGPA